MNFLRSHGLFFAWLAALIGFLMSLYFSEIERIEPCRLCWFQRIALFPLAIQLGIAAYHSDERIIRYAMPLSVFGLIVALLQIFEPWLGIHGLCGTSVDCEKAIPNLFGAIPFSWVSAAGFALISLLLSNVTRRLERPS